MDRRINKKLDMYTIAFKDAIRDKSIELGLKNEQMNHLLQYIYD